MNGIVMRKVKHEAISIDSNKYKRVGDGVKLLKLHGEVIEEETLNNLKDQLGKKKGLSQIILDIASPGGSVSEGLEIMVWLDSLSQSGIEVTTIVTANAYSIASLIMLAADVRLISKHGEVMVHNPMVPELEYVNANDLEQHLKSLRGLESMMYELYEIFTGLDKDSMKKLMDEETFLNPNKAVELGFADMVVDIEKRSYEMKINNDKKKINMNKTKSVLNKLNRVISMVNKLNYVNQLYYDKEGGEIEITQKDPVVYGVGDKTSLREGEVVLADGAKVIIEDFIITDIDRTAPTEAVIEGAEPKDDEIKNLVEEKYEDFIITDIDRTAPTEAVIEGAEPKDDEIKNLVEEKYEDLLNKYSALEARMKTIEDSFSQNAISLDKFQEVTAEAIDTIASNTTSNFKPQAKVSVQSGLGSSIFKNLLAQKRGQ